ncbi:MAG: FG-GAP repeat protein [Desulfobulbia bacterium]
MMHKTRTLGAAIVLIFVFAQIEPTHSTTFNLEQTFNDPTPTNYGDAFGTSVAIDGNNVLIGAPNDRTQG